MTPSKRRAPQSLVRKLLLDRAQPGLLAGLLAVALATVFVFPGYDRGQFYRSTEHDALSGNHLAGAANLSPEHGFLHFRRRHFDADGELTYQTYHRFPLLGHVLIKLAGLPFGYEDLSGRLHAARILMLVFFAGAAGLAFAALRCLTGRSFAAFAATLCAFSSYPVLYWSDVVTTEGAMDLFVVMLAFHGVAVYSRRLPNSHGAAPRRAIGQLYAKACVAPLFGWHVYGLLLPLLLLALSHAVCVRDWRRFQQFALVGVAAVFVGLAMLAFNLMREYQVLGGSAPFLDLPSVRSMLHRTGVTPAADFIGWGAFIEDQFRRIGEGTLPWVLAEPLQGSLYDHWHWVGGVCAATAAIAVFLPGTRHRIAWGALALCGMAWALPMRYNVQEHEFEAMFHIGVPLVAGALVLSKAQAFAAALSPRADYAVKAVMVAAGFALFVASSWLLSRVVEDAETRQWERMLLADVEEIRRHTQGKVVYAPRAVLEWNPCCRYVYLTGSVMALKPSPSPDYVVATNIPRSDPRRTPAPNTPASLSLTPCNRVLFLYKWDDFRTELAAVRGVYERHADTGDRPAIESVWDVHHLDDALLYVGEGDRCLGPEREDTEPGFFLHVYPVDWHDLPERSRRDGFAKLFIRRDRNWINEGRCFAVAFLPSFPIGAIHTGQFVSHALVGGGYATAWEGRLFPRQQWSRNGEDVAAVRQEYRRIAAGEPVARAAWNVHLLPRADGGREIAFLKAPCGRGDSAARFFVHVVPVDSDVLPVSRRRLKFDNWDFHFSARGGVLFDGRCFVRVRLPDYDIANVRTGQYDATVGELWRVEFPVPRTVH